jgi:hypothetical protein
MEPMMRRISFVAMFWLFAGAAPVQSETALPSSGCFDARQVQQTVQGDAHTLAVRLGDGTRYRVDLGLACPGIAAQADVRLASPSGRVCGRGDEYVLAGGHACPVAFIFPLDAAAFDALAAQGLRAAPVLGRVVVNAPRHRGFRGDTTHCLDAQWMRGWHEDADGLVVEVSAKRSGGYRYYRVELEAGCDRGDSGHGLRLTSNIGGSMICGSRGDQAVFSSDLERSGFAAAFSRARVSHFARAGGRGCTVAQVYPLDGLPGRNSGR